MIVMKTGQDTILKVAEVARLNLTPHEADKFSRDLEDILEAFKKLDEAKTEGIEPTFHPVEVKNVFREDEAAAGLSAEAALSNTKNKEDGQFRGPKVV